MRLIDCPENEIGDWAHGDYSWQREMRMPFVSGWYWVRHIGDPKRTTRIIPIDEFEQWIHLYQDNHEWAGPLPVPAERDDG